MTKDSDRRPVSGAPRQTVESLRRGPSRAGARSTADLDSGRIGVRGPRGVRASFRAISASCVAALALGGATAEAQTCSPAEVAAQAGTRPATEYRALCGSIRGYLATTGRSGPMFLADLGVASLAAAPPAIAACLEHRALCTILDADRSEPAVRDAIVRVEAIAERWSNAARGCAVVPRPPPLASAPFCANSRTGALPDASTIEALGLPLRVGGRLRMPTAAFTASEGSSAPADATSTPAVLDALTTGNTTALAELLLRGLAQFLVTRARAELQTYVVDRIRTLACPHVEQVAAAPTTAAGIAERRGQVLRATLLQTTCTFLGSQQLEFEASVGRGFQAAVSRDIALLPQHTLTVLENPMLAATPAALASKEELLLRLGLATLVVALESPTPEVAAGRLSQRIAGWTCGAPYTDCQTHIDAIRTSVSLFTVAAREQRSGASLEDAIAAVESALESVNHAPPPAPPDPAAPHFTTTFANVAPMVVELYAAVRELQLLSAPANPPAAPSPASGGAATNTASGPDLDRATHIEAATRHLLTAFNFVLQQALGPGTRDVIPMELASFVGAVASQNLAQAVTSGLAVVGRFIGDQQLPDGLVRVLSFGGEIASARTPDDVSTAIDGFAAPVGAWRGKARRPMFSLTGFVGIAGGGELPLATHGLGSDLAPTVAPFAAVGFDLSAPISPSNPAWGSIGLFVPIVDVGALLTVAGSQTTPAGTTASAQFNALQFVTPGLFARWGFGFAPLTLGVGATFAPDARTEQITAANGQTTSADIAAFRFLAFLGVDITILPF